MAEGPRSGRVTFPGSVDDHFTAITPATGRSPPRSSRPSCR